MQGTKRAENLLFCAAIVAMVATVGSLYLSEVLKFEPCKLCWIQRIFMYPLTWLLAVAHFRRDFSIKGYAWPLVVVGGLISLYHTILQKLPPDPNSTSCGAVSCYSDYLNWFGFITIPMLALTAFVLIGGCLALMKTKE